MSEANSGIDGAISALLPSGWAITHILSLGQGWQANIADDESVVIGTGETITFAILDAALNSQDPRKHKTKFQAITRWQDHNKVSLADLLRFRPEPSQPLRRI